MASKEFYEVISKYPPAAYYRFSSGALTTDSSGNGHTLTDISDPAEDASGQFGGAVALDGNDAYSAVDHADFQPTGNFTIGAWVKTTSVAQGFIFQSYSLNPNHAGFYFGLLATGEPLFLIAPNSGTAPGNYRQVSGNTPVNDGNWHFCVATFDGTYLRVYVDGLIDKDPYSAAGYSPAYAATNYVQVGCRNRLGTPALFFNGSLDDVWLINGTALTQDDINYIYNEIINRGFLTTNKMW